MYLDDLIKLLELIKVKYGYIPSYLLNKQFDLFTEINRVYVEDVSDYVVKKFLKVKENVQIDEFISVYKECIGENCFSFLLGF